MSPQAIEQRLNELSDLYEFWKAIRSAKRVGPVTQTQPTMDGQNALAISTAGLPTNQQASMELCRS